MTFWCFLFHRAAQPSVIFVDEMESLLKMRVSGSGNDASAKIKSEFLVQMVCLCESAGLNALVPSIMVLFSFRIIFWIRSAKCCSLALQINRLI